MPLGRKGPYGKYNVKLTEQQKKLIEAVKENPNATLKELAKKSQYTQPANVLTALKAPQVKATLERFRERMAAREEFQDDRILDGYADGMKAWKRDPAGPDNLPDFPTRRDYLNDVTKLKGYWKEAQLQDNPQMQVLVINSINQSMQDGLSE